MKLPSLVLLVFFAGVLRSQALYDPKPVDFLAAVEGEWTGTLKYRDYSPPYGLVTLPTTLYASLSAPDELTLHYIFDDGPGKIVHSYEKLKVDLTAQTVRWSGMKTEDVTVGRIIDIRQEAGACRITAESDEKTGDKQKVSRYTLRFSADGFESTKEESDGTQPPAFRDGYTFGRRKTN